jgi:glycosyltransferase involved in cell wall biosynthesis
MPDHSPTPARGHSISVVIPTMERSALAECRASLERQTLPADEIIVVVDKQRRGAGWARNQGIAQAKGDLIAFIDDDCVAPADWLQTLAEAIDHHAAAGAGGTYQETDPFLDDVRRRRGFPETTQVDTSGLVAACGNVMYRRSCLDTCTERDGHVFNENFIFSQDVELAWRIRRHGGQMIFVPKKVAHLRRVDFGSYCRLQFRRGIGIANLYRAQRAADSEIAIHDSLLWGSGGVARPARWTRAILVKAIGPFDVSSFRRTRYFLRFWFGEKVQALGFLWGLVGARY